MLKKTKPTSEEMRLKAQRLLKEAREMEKLEKQAADVKLGQLLRSYLSKKISLKELVAEGGAMVGLATETGGEESVS